MSIISTSEFLKEDDVKTVESPAGQEVAESETRNGVICNSPFVSIKIAPSESARVVDYLPENEQIEILEVTKEFYKIRFGRAKRVGFVSVHCCREV